MKKSIFKTWTFWLIFLAFIASLLVIFITPYLYESFADLSYRLLIAFSIFFGTIIVILFVLLFKKEETQDIIKEKREKREIDEEYKNIIKQKVKDIKIKFNDAIKIIKKSSLYKNKRIAKYELPWYLVVGDKNEGKTTLLEYSGLDFPLNVNYNEKEIIEERNSDEFQWYFAEHSVFIDMPGKYIEQKENPEDPIVWKEFLKIFTKKRWQRPINGIILSVSVDKLLDKTEKELEQYAKDLRDRFDELSKAFMSSVPIYLIITKSDKIDGFNEYFATLTDDEKNEILGVTFDHENKNIDTSIVRPELENLLKRINSSVLEKMHYEWEEENRARIFSFCENFSNLFEKTNLFIDICFAQTRYRKPLMLRGIYFTSVPGEYNPHALVHQDSLELSRNTKGLFIKKLLEDIIFPEAEIIKMDKNHEERTKKGQVIAYIAALLIVVFFGFVMVKDFINHNTVLTNLEKSYQVYKSKKDKITDDDTFETSIAVLDDLAKIREYEKKNTSDYFWNLIFYKIDDRNLKLDEMYYNDLKTLLLPRVAKHIEKNMRHELKSFDRTWDNTKAYVMLENLKRRESKFLKSYMSKRWNELYPKNTQVQNNLNYHWNKMLEHGFGVYTLNRKTLKLTRERLTKLGSETLTYKSLKAKFELMDIKDFSFSEVLGNNIASFTGNNYSIPGFYTKKGYNLMVKEGRSFTKNILLNNWVIGKKTDLSFEEVSEHYKKILSYYFSDYKKEWINALGKLNVPKYRTIAALNNQLSILSSAESPVISILRALKENTQLYTPAELVQMKSKDDVGKAVVDNMITGTFKKIIAKKVLNSAGDSVDNTSIKNLREFFKPYNNLLDKEDQATSVLKNAVDKINKTYETMTSIYGAVTPAFDSYKIVSDRIQGRIEPIVVPLNSLPPHVKKWFTHVLQENWKFLLNHSKAYLNSKYKKEVLSFYNERLKGRYPINKKADNHFVKLDDFSEFFKKEGVLDKFFKTYISNFVSINSNYSSYNYKNLDGNTLSINKTFMQAILRGYRIRNVFFKNDGTLGLSAAIKPQDLTSNLATMEFMYDDQTIYYEHGPIKSKKIVWPPQSLNNVVKFNLYDLSNNLVVKNYLDNDWSLFNILDKFTIKSTGNGAVIMTYKDSDYYGAFYLKGKVSTMFNKYNSLSSFYLSEHL